ncbi:hypothetical protein ACHAQA_000510 [Verticillium albo-atrum]
MASGVPYMLEDAVTEWRDKTVLYRIRVPAREADDPHPGRVIKYLTSPHPPKGAGDMPDYRGRFLAFDTVPPGDWNLGHLVISSGSAEGKFVLASTEKTDLGEAVGLLDAGPAWCGRKVEVIDLLDAFYARREGEQVVDDDTYKVTDIQCMNDISALIVPTPPSISAAVQGLGPDVVGSWAWQPGHAHGIADASHAHSIIQARDPSLTPRLLAHITDNGTRVIGHLFERIVGAREAGTADLAKCRDTLRRLHALGIAYGTLRRHSFLVVGEEVRLQGLGGSFETTDEGVLGRELETLEQVLAQEPSDLEEFNARVPIPVDDDWRKPDE